MRKLVGMLWVLALIAGLGLAWWSPDLAYGIAMLIAAAAFVLDIMTTPAKEKR
jgi:hypothetical protein